MENTSPATIKNNHDHTNLLAVREYVDDLVKYCFGIYASFQKTQAEEEQRNERLKLEYREYQFRKSYSEHCQVVIYAGGQRTEFTDYANFQSALLGGMILGVDYLQISLNLSHYVGKYDSRDEHQHEYTIRFEPAKSYFLYAANMDDQNMNIIETQIEERLNSFPASITIFSKKGM